MRPSHQRLEAAWPLVFACLLAFSPIDRRVCAQTLDLPPRPANAPTGTEFARRIAPLDLTEREKEVVAQISSGNVPNFLRNLCPVPATSAGQGTTNTATFYATPDYLAVGSDDGLFPHPYLAKHGAANR